MQSFGNLCQFHLENLEYLNVLVQSILGWLENLAVGSESGKVSI